MTFFGPEMPTPFCVVSEQQLRHSVGAMFARTQCTRPRARPRSAASCAWANELELDMCNIINKYLEIDCRDDILFVQASGDDTGTGEGGPRRAHTSMQNWPALLETRYCLVKPVDRCELKARGDAAEGEPPYEIVFQDNSKGQPGKKYDKVLVKNCLQLFGDDAKLFCDFVAGFFKHELQTKPGLLIIQRVSDLNTLPFTTAVAAEWAANDTRYTKFMEGMQNEFFTVRFDIEMLKYLLDCKSSWYLHMKERSTYPLNQNSVVPERLSTPHELLHGIRELDEGIFKYHQFDKSVEMCDRLLFIAATHEASRAVRQAERMRAAAALTGKEARADLKRRAEQMEAEMQRLRMEITPDIRPLIAENGSFS